MGKITKPGKSKGFILSAQELVGLVIIVIIIVFLTSLGSKYSELFLEDNAGERDLNNFMDEVIKFSEKARDNSVKATSIRLPEKTALFSIWSNYKNEVVRCSDFEEHWLNPGEKCKGDCVCLLRVKSSEFREAGGDTGTQKGMACGTPKSVKDITPEVIACREVPNDFLFYGVDWVAWDNFAGDRGKNLAMNFVKKNNTVYVCKNPPCNIPVNPIKHPTKSK